MSDIYEQYERNGLDIKIYQDDDATSPREDDNFGTMICSHRSYTLGDEQFDPEDYDGWDDLAKHLREDEKAVIVLPLSLYDHSGISIYVSGTVTHQHEAWDSGQVGFIYCTREQVDNEFDGDMDRAEKLLRAEVENYDDYLTGNVYGFAIENPKTGEDVESCWGFIGDVKYCKEEADSIADGYTHPQYLNKPIPYSSFRELLKDLNVNPQEFRKLSGKNVTGYWPNMRLRTEPKVNIHDLAEVMWRQSDV